MTDTYTAHTAPYAALLLRLALGTMFLAHGLLKIMVFTPAGTAGFFASLGLPGWLAYPTMGAEVLGGLLLIAGVQTRYVALALVPILVGSLWVHSGNGWLFTEGPRPSTVCWYVHSGFGWLFTNENGGWEYSLFLTVAAVAQALLGDGAYSLNALFSKNSESYTKRVSAA